jgi:threonine/homoserine/homoserine lactone efflux protein
MTLRPATTPALLAVVLVATAADVRKDVQRASSIEAWARRITGGALVVIGNGLTVTHVFLA